MKIILSTRNQSKVDQILPLFEGTGIEIVTLEKAGIRGQAVEDGKSLEDNARKKASYALEMSLEMVWAMSDDTGLFIDALGGEPGHLAAVWAGEGKTEKEIMQFCLDKLKGKMDRSATFKTCVCLYSSAGECRFFYGEAHGEILKTPRSEPQKNMPYSAIFKPDASEKVWAEMSVDEENEISHRGKAFRQVQEFLCSVSSR